MTAEPAEATAAPVEATAVPAEATAASAEATAVPAEVTADSAMMAAVTAAVRSDPAEGSSQSAVLRTTAAALIRDAGGAATRWPEVHNPLAGGPNPLECGGDPQGFDEKLRVLVKTSGVLVEILGVLVKTMRTTFRLYREEPYRAVGSYSRLRLGPVRTWILRAVCRWWRLGEFPLCKSLYSHVSLSRVMLF